MHADVAAVLGGAKRWACVASDALDFLRALPDDSMDLLFTSPPYEAARSYSIGFARTGEGWVRWMAEVVETARPKVRGLIAVNCEGQTRDFDYSATPFLLLADLKRSGVPVRKPPIYRRVGIPGSGGKDWLRNDYEPILCVTRGGQLPWSDITACGKPPRFKPGGRLSHRTADGTRVGVRMKRTSSGGGDLVTRDGVYVPPDVANPGNVIDCRVGGGNLGHPLAHENEAPFPLELAAFFVKSFCPPDGVVLDCFSGSGTTCHAAVEHGRRFVGCDVRESQVALCERRIAGVTTSLFAAAGG